jgi:hypothetical protein
MRIAGTSASPGTLAANMKESYPFIPKSNSKLRKGHFWPLKMSNGMYGCGIVLDIPSKDSYGTKMFFAGLTNWCGKEKPTTEDLTSFPLSILDQGKAYINTILNKGDAILGKIDLDQLGLEPVL